MFIEIRQQNDSFCILRCEGSLVPGPEMEYMQEKLDELRKLACKRLLVDFQDVDSIGSTGVNFVVAVFTSVTRQPGGRFVLTGVNTRVRRVLDLTRVSSLIPFASDIPSGSAMLEGTAA
jgi:anti-anti-sigma factor